MSEQCVFCDEIEQGKNLVAENTIWRARWDLFPVAPGHVELVPKRHVERVADLNEEELTLMMKFARRVMRIIDDKDLIGLYEAMPRVEVPQNQEFVELALAGAARWRRNPDGYNQGFNDGAAAGQTVPHVHYHLIPRWEGDVPNPRGGIRRIFPNDPYSNQSIGSNGASS